MPGKLEFLASSHWLMAGKLVPAGFGDEQAYFRAASADPVGKKKLALPEPASPYREVEAMVWHRLDPTTLHALYDQRHERGGGNKQIDFGITIPLHDFLGVPKPVENQRFTVPVHSSDESVVQLPLELNVRGQKSVRTTWRLINQNKAGSCPAEWRPGGPRLPADIQAVPDGFLLLLRDTSKKIHARVVFRSELAKELDDLAPLVQAVLGNTKQASGMWPSP